MKVKKKPGLQEWRLAKREANEIIVTGHEQHESRALRPREEAPGIKDLWDRSTYFFVPVSHSTDEEWLAERAKYAMLLLRECVEVNPGKHGGVPVIRGTRFPIAQFFAELSEGLSLNDIAADFDLDRDVLRALLEGLSIHLDRPLLK